MKRGAQCVAQTINLSNPKSCVRPRQVQKLVNADVKEPCVPEPGQGSYVPGRPVPVRICGREEMAGTCAPELCDCPQRLTAEQRAKKKSRRTLKLVLKSLVMGGVIYWTASEGVWGDSSDTEELYGRIISTVAPIPDDGFTDVSDVQVPKVDTLKYQACQSYNQGVLKVMGYLVGVPLKIQKKINEYIYPQDDKKKLQKGAA